MHIAKVVAQLRTRSLAASIHFYTVRLGFALEFLHQDFYAGIRAGDQVFHLKRIDEQDPSIGFVEEGGHFHLYFETDDIEAVARTLKEDGIAFVEELHETAWATREFVINDDQGHTLYFGQPLPA